MAQTELVRTTSLKAQLYPADTTTGGKAKPLKAPKKAPKAELDDEDKAFLEKQRAGMSHATSGKSRFSY